MFTLTADASMLSMVNIILVWKHTILAADTTQQQEFWHQVSQSWNVAYLKKWRIGVSYFTPSPKIIF